MSTLQERLNRAIDKVILTGKKPGRRTRGGQPCCYYCGRPFSDGVLKDVDHVTPTCKGGVDEAFNKIEVCIHCNRKKNGRHPVYWLMLGEMDLDDEQLLEWLARVLYHQLVVQPREAAFSIEADSL